MTKNVFLVLLALVLALNVGLVACGGYAEEEEEEEEENCIDFEGMSLGAVYHVGDRFTDSGVEIRVDPFQWSDGPWYNGGYTEVVDGDHAGGSGEGMGVYNVNLFFSIIDEAWENLSLLFGGGGTFNIQINGEFKNFEYFADINGDSIGDVDVVINDFGGGKGSLKLSGIIDSFAIGGQELSIDHVCYTPAEPTGLCVDFEDLTVGTQYHVGDTFTDSDVQIRVDRFQYETGTWTEEGRTEVAYFGCAVGGGQRMAVVNVNLRFDFGGPCEGLSLLFGGGGTFNIQINGDFKNFDEFADINGASIGNVTVVVDDLGNSIGRLTLSGSINSFGFAIGGQQLCIDNVCCGLA